MFSSRRYSACSVLPCRGGLEYELPEDELSEDELSELDSSPMASIEGPTGATAGASTSSAAYEPERLRARTHNASKTRRLRLEKCTDFRIFAWRPRRPSHHQLTRSSARTITPIRRGSRLSVGLHSFRRHFPDIAILRYLRIRTSKAQSSPSPDFDAGAKNLQSQGTYRLAAHFRSSKHSSGVPEK